MSGTQKPKKPTTGRPRLGARVAAVQALFQSEANGDSVEAVIQQFVRHRIGAMPGEGGYDDGRVPLADVPLFSQIVRNVGKHAETLDAMVAAQLTGGWSMDRLDPVLRALLRAAASELWSSKEPPAKVVINEYMDVAHGFFDEAEPRFANGVLDSLARQLRPGEFAATRA
ncbi:transcription antitermination factor NusB [Roseomonas sp. OT10]|uniref:transcription antitermination factor NusB n=1 Tax=Roseomonas cutis TaxID=2897332 RepID=UPI001E63E07C|nr:transcription antitermination factor NusB [Roseomonas sp. OT10]UFN50756.1 transcription antitermination factor NusB [Roseomonas sp. OT10]